MVPATGPFDGHSVTFITTQDGFLNCFNADTGQFLWRSEDYGMLTGAPGGWFSVFSAGPDDLAYLGTRNAGARNAIVALDIRDGQLVWSFDDPNGSGIGIIAGGICFWACTWLKLRMGYDDSLDVFGVHGIGGFTGTLLAGVFAVGALSATPETPGGIHGLVEGNPHQVVAQLYGIVVTVIWSGAVTFIILKVIGAIVPLRVKPEEEIMGLDVTLHGEAIQ